MEQLVKTEIEYFTLDTNEGNNLSDETLIKQEEGLDVDYPCVFCDAILTDRESLSDHIETDHKLNFKITNIETVPSVATPQNSINVICEKITCRYCNEVLTRATFLAHIESSCSGISYYRKNANSKILRRHYYISCQVCDMNFSRLKTVIDHCIQEHKIKMNEVTPYSCAACPKRFRASNGLVKHHRIIHGEPLWKCSICNSYLGSERKVKEHFCQKRRSPIKYTIKPEVDTVKLSAEGGAIRGPRKKYKCQECGAAFAMKRNRRLHIEFKHLNGKPLLGDYVYRRCEKGFSSSGALAVHQVQHPNYNKSNQN